MAKKLLDTDSLTGVFHEIKQAIDGAFDNLTPAQKAEIKGDTGATGATGPQGPQGDSVLVGEGDLPLAHVTGLSNQKAMSQVGVTDALHEGMISSGDIADSTAVSAYISGSSSYFYVNIETGNFVARENQRSIEISLTERIKSISYQASGYSTINAGYVFLDDNDEVVYGEKTTEDGTLTIDNVAELMLQGATKFRCCRYDPNHNYIVVTIVSEFFGWPKAYDSTGDNTDGWMTQKAVKNALAQERALAKIGSIGDASEDLMVNVGWSTSYGYINADEKTRVATTGRYKTSSRIYTRGYKAVRISICNTSPLTGFGFYDSNGNFLGGENGIGDNATSEMVYIEKVLPVPFRTAFIILTKDLSYDDEPICVGLESAGGTVEIERLANAIDGLAKYDYEEISTVWEHKQIWNDGSVHSSDSYVCSGHISTENIRRVRSLAEQQVKINVALYDSEKVFVSQVLDYSEDFTTFPLDTPYVRLWFECSDLEEANSLIEITKWVTIKEQIETLNDKTDELQQAQGTTLVEFSGNGGTAIFKHFMAKAGHIYKFQPLRTEWLVSEISSGYVVFGISANGEYIERVIKGNQAYECFYAARTDADVTLAFRGNEGIKMVVIIEDVTYKFNALKYDVAFVDNEGIQESMMVKLDQGDLVRYVVNSDGENAAIKAYSRARRDDEYLVDSVVMPQGVNEGEYLPKEEVFLVVESVETENFTPSYKVYNVGEENKKLKYPHQIKFDSANIQVILSTQDEDVTIYDDNAINYGQIIEHDGVYVLLYQAFGSWNDNKAATIMMAYSTDGENWQRGIPEGLPVPYAGTNIVIRGDEQIVGLFSKEHVDSFWVCKVNDYEYPYRILATIRKTPSSIQGERFWLFKSANLTNWIPIKQVSEKGHDTFPSLVSYGDCIKAYVRMWDYTATNAKKRMVGVMWMDLNGNVLVPPSGLYGQGLYNPAVTRIGPDRELAIPTRFFAETSLMVGTDELESYIIEKDKIIYAPSYGIDELKYPGTRGWVWGIGLFAIGLNQYFLFDTSNKNHASEIGASVRQLCLCPIEWITYNSPNRDS